MIEGTCPTGALRYRDKIRAGLAAKPEQRGKWCEVCRGYHLVDKPKRNRGGQ